MALLKWSRPELVERIKYVTELPDKLNDAIICYRIKSGAVAILVGANGYFGFRYVDELLIQSRLYFESSTPKTSLHFLFKDSGERDVFIFDNMSQFSAWYVRGIENKTIKGLKDVNN